MRLLIILLYTSAWVFALTAPRQPSSLSWDRQDSCQRYLLQLPEYETWYEAQFPAAEYCLDLYSLDFDEQLNIRIEYWSSGKQYYWTDSIRKSETIYCITSFDDSKAFFKIEKLTIL